MDSGPHWPGSPGGQLKAQHPPIVPVWPRPSSGCLSQATVSRLFIFKIPVVFLPEPKGAMPATASLRPGLGPRGAGRGIRPPCSCWAILGGLRGQLACRAAQEALECPDFRPEALASVLSGGAGAHPGGNWSVCASNPAAHSQNESPLIQPSKLGRSIYREKKRGTRQTCGGDSSDAYPLF